MAMPSSPIDMPADIFRAAIKGERDVLIRCLGLQPELEQTEIQVTIQADPPTSQQIEADQHAVQDILGSVTHFGDTLLHLLVTKKHNELALMVFKRERSLMKVRNKDFETPLHCAAKVGNEKVIQALIQLAPEVIKESVRQTDINKDTALHVAAKHGHEGVAHELMMSDPRVAYMVNKEEFYPLYIATVGGYTSIVKTMLKDDCSLACQEYSNGMFPVHVAARVGNTKLVRHFMDKYPDDTNLLDRRGWNLFHFAAEENNWELISDATPVLGHKLERLINKTDYKGNTPLHVAAMKGNAQAMHVIYKEKIWANNPDDVDLEVQNYKGLTPFDISKNQIMTKASKDMQRKIESYVKNNGDRFTREWFEDIMQPYKNSWDRVQVIGLGSVLITTVTFAAAFAIPGGYNQDLGTPILGRKYVFKAFILANTQSFIQAFISLLTLVMNALSDPDAIDLRYATYTFIAAAGCMVVAFGLGSYVILAPISFPIAIIVLVYTLLLGSPLMYHVIEVNKYFFGDTVQYYKINRTLELARDKVYRVLAGLCSHVDMLNFDKLVAWRILGLSLLGIFLIALA